MHRLALASGAHVVNVPVRTPDALAVALRVRVNNAARFLQDRLRGLVLGARAHETRYDGLLVEVDDARGVAWASANTPLGGEEYRNPSLSGCDPFRRPVLKDRHRSRAGASEHYRSLVGQSPASADHVTASLITVPSNVRSGRIGEPFKGLRELPDHLSSRRRRRLSRSCVLSRSGSPPTPALLASRNDSDCVALVGHSPG
jgi:hypothetical protein